MTETFRDLLKKAIGDNTNSEFAEKVGITRGYLQHLLCGRSSNPSADVITRIVKHSEGRVKIEEMIDACGLDVKAFSPSQKRSVLSFSEWCKGNAEDVLEFYKDINSKRLFVFNLNEFKSDFQLLYSASICNVLVRKPENYEGEEVADVVIPVIFKWSNGTYEKIQEMQTLLFAVQNKKGQLIVTKATCAPADMAMASPRLKAELTDIDDTIDDGSSLFDAPYIYSTRNFQVEENPVAQKLLKAIFGSEPDNVLSLYGFGFYLNDEPDEFIDFVKNHKEAFLQGNHYNDFKSEDAEKFMEDVVEKEGDPEEFFSRFEETNISGYAQVIAGIIENETGLKISGNDHKNEDDRNQNCVFVQSKHIEELENNKEGARIDAMRAVREDIIKILIPYAKELNIDTIETCFFYLPVNANESFWREYKIS